MASWLFILYSALQPSYFIVLLRIVSALALRVLGLVHVSLDIPPLSFFVLGLVLERFLLALQDAPGPSCALLGSVLDLVAISPRGLLLLNGN